MGPVIFARENLKPVLGAFRFEWSVLLGVVVSVEQAVLREELVVLVDGLFVDQVAHRGGGYDRNSGLVTNNEVLRAGRDLLDVHGFSLE